MVDLVYLVRPGDDNEELRYSLRTLVNLEHDRVWFVGHRPSWVTAVEHIPGNRWNAKALNVLDNVRLACEHPDVSDEVVIMNDDFFILEPLTPAVWIRGTLASHLSKVAHRLDTWAQSLRNTAEWLRRQGIPEPLSYELHTPFPVDKAKMADALRRVGSFGHPHPPQWRTVYGNLHAVEAPQRPDCKIRAQALGDEVLAGGLLSTTGSTFEWVRDELAARFPDPSPYERR